MAAELSRQAREFTPGVSWSGQDGAGGGAGERKEESMRRGGFWNSDLGWWVPFYVGKLKSFNVRTGYGFLDCEQTKAIYHTDVYIHKSQVPVPWRGGQPVEFAVSQNHRGQPQASDVLWLPMTAAPEPPTAPVEATSRPDQKARSRHLGTMKSYSASQGYGFISSEDMLEKHSCDVYLDRGQLPPSGEWRPGQVIEFEVLYNRRGQPQARQVNWEPIPLLHRDTTTGNPPRAADISGTRNLNRVSGALRSGDRTSAVKTALELQEMSDSIDFVSFVLERLGPASREVAEELEDATPVLLLIELSRMLGVGLIVVTRVGAAVAWCDVLLEFVSPRALGAVGGAGMKLDNVMQLLRGNFEMAAANSVSSAEAAGIAAILAKLSDSAARA